MITLIAFDLDSTLAESKEAIKSDMAEALSKLLAVAHVAIISGADWPRFHKHVASRLPPSVDPSKLWLMPTTGTKLYTYRDGAWQVVYAELFSDQERRNIIKAFELSLSATGFTPEQTWGERIEDRGSQITFSALGQQAPVEEKQDWIWISPKEKSSKPTFEHVSSDFPSTWLQITSGIPLEQMMVIGDAIFPGENDHPAKEIELKTVKVKNPDGTLAATATIVACLK
ncbi:hypothetical protein D6D05_10504 [Aureobasidium pullulans]|nr:hypothetical protein D6D05_10504 [Aureobasidium pullulans]